MFSGWTDVEQLCGGSSWKTWKDGWQHYKAHSQVHRPTIPLRCIPYNLQTYWIKQSWILSRVYISLQQPTLLLLFYDPMQAINWPSLAWTMFMFIEHWPNIDHPEVTWKRCFTLTSTLLPMLPIWSGNRRWVGSGEKKYGISDCGWGEGAK